MYEKEKRMVEELRSESSEKNEQIAEVIERLITELDILHGNGPVVDICV